MESKPTPALARPAATVDQPNLYAYEIYECINYSQIIFW